MKTLTVLMPQYKCLQVRQVISNVYTAHQGDNKMNEYVVSERTCMLYNISSELSPRSHDRSYYEML